MQAIFPRRILYLYFLIAVALPAVGGPAIAQRAETSREAIVLPRARAEIVRYNRTQYALYFAGSAWEFLGLGLIIRLGIGRILRDRAARMARLRPECRPERERRIHRVKIGRVLHSRFTKAAIVFTGISALMLVWRLPFQLGGFAVERAYGLATLGPGLWLWDRVLGLLIGLIRIPAVWLGYLLLERAPKRWWLILWACSIPWTLVMTVLTPVLFDPAYNRFQPLNRPDLERRLLDLAHRAGIPKAQVLVADYSKRTKKVNAYVTGIGPTARMVIWDTTLAAMSEDEIVAIMGHEIGHYVLNHVWWSFVGGVGASFLILGVLSLVYPWAVVRFGRRNGICSPSDIAALPIALFLLTLLLFLQTPLESAFSRYQEGQADHYGLVLTRMPEATARAFVSFVERNYSDPDPPAFIVFWFYSHPPLRDRIETALAARR